MVGLLVKKFRLDRGYTVRSLAKRSNVSPSTVSRIETGDRECTIDIAAALDHALGTGGVIAAQASLPSYHPSKALQIGLDDVNRRTFLATAVAGTGLMPHEPVEMEPTSSTKVHSQDVEYVREWTTSLQQLDERMGGGLGREAVGAFLSTTVSDLCHRTPDTPQVREDIFSAAAEVAYLAGWKAHDVRQDALAQRYWHGALSLAVQAGQPAQVGFIHRMLALQASDFGPCNDAVSHAERAVEYTQGRGGHVESLMLVTLARASAEAGDSVIARDMLRRATPELESTAAPETPRYIEAWCPQRANLLNHTGHTLMALGAVRDAVDYHAAARDMWDPVTHPRVWGLDCYLVGLAWWRLGDQGAAEYEWRRTIEALTRVESRRGAARIEQIRRVMPHL